MHFDPSQSQAMEFLGGLSDILYPKEVGSTEDDFKSSEEDNQIVISEKEKQKKTDRLNQEIQSEITKIFSNAHSVPVLKGQLRETLSKAVLSQPGKDLPERLRSVDRHVRLFFASNFADLSTAASRSYDPQIEYLNEHKITKQPNDPEITLDAIFNALDSTRERIGVKLEQEIKSLRIMGLFDYVEGVKNFLYAFGNGSSNLEDFIKLIGTFKDTLSEDQLRAVKRNLNTLITACTQLQKISENHKLVNPKSSEVDTQRIFEKYQTATLPLDLKSDQLVGIIEQFEVEVFEEMQKKGFHFNKKKENFEIKNEPPLIEDFRKKIINKLKPSQLFQILESERKTMFKEGNLLSHWKQLCLEAMKGKEVEYLNHLNHSKEIDWNTYPWDVFYTISKNCPVAQRAPFAQFFEKHAYEIPMLQLELLVDIFFGTFAKARRENFVNSILEKCNGEPNPSIKMLAFIIRVNLGYRDEIRNEWNKLILKGIDFEKNLKTVALYMSSLIKLGTYSIYLQILDYIKRSNKSALLEQFRQYIADNNKRTKIQLTDEEWSKFSSSILEWCWHYIGSFDRKFYDIAIVTPVNSYEKAASMRFKDRTKPAPNEAGLTSGVSAKLEGEALAVLSNGLPDDNKVKKATSLLSDKMSYSSFCSQQLNAIVESTKKKYAQEVIVGQKMSVVNSFLSQAGRLGNFPDDFLFIPASVSGHAMQLTIIKQVQEVGEPKLSVYITNTGGGVENHPFMKGPPIKYSTTAKIGEITQEKLMDADFWKGLVDIFTGVLPDPQARERFTSDQINKLYATLKIACGRGIDSSLQTIEHTKNFYPAKRRQHGEVCAVSCIRDITKTLFDLILFEQAEDKDSTSSFADSYLESELAMERLDQLIAERYLKADNASVDISGKELKLNKKAARSFEKFAITEEFPQTRQFLIDQIFDEFNRTQRPMKDHLSLGESAREIKDLTKILVLKWIKENKKIEDVQSLHGHPILEVAKRRFEYKRRAIEEALEYIKKMKMENTSEKNTLFIINLFEELRSFGAENIIIDQLKSSIPQMRLTSENAIFLARLMELVNKDESSRVNVVKLVHPLSLYMMGMIDKTSEVELSIGENVLLGTFCLIAKNEVLDFLKPAFENFKKRPFTISEFYLFREVLENTSETVQSKIIENLIRAGKHRDPKLTAKEIIFPFILTFKLLSTETKTTIYDDTIAHLISETEKYLESREDKEYLRSLLPKLQRERR